MVIHGVVGDSSYTFNTFIKYIFSKILPNIHKVKLEIKYWHNFSLSFFFFVFKYKNLTSNKKREGHWKWENVTK